MIKNYFVLNRLIIEADEILSGFEIRQIFSQEKDKLIIECFKEPAEYFIEISVNPGFPYLNIRTQFHRAKKNVVDIFEEAVPDKLESFFISEFDRTIKIEFENGNLFFPIRGKYTNVILVDNRSNVLSFKKEDEKILADFVNEMNKTKFIQTYKLPDIPELKDENQLEKIRKEMPFISKDVIAETKARFDEFNPENIKEELEEVLLEIRDDQPALFIDKNNFDVDLAFSSFKIYPYREVDVYNNLIEAVNRYLSKTFFLEDVKEKDKLIRKHLDRELKHVSSKLNGINIQLERGSKEEEYEKVANLLLINLHKAKKGFKEVEVEDIYSDNEKIKIKLDDKLSPKQNVDKYFHKAKSDRIRIEKAREQLSSVKKEYEKLNRYKQRLDKAETREDYKNIMDELNIKKQRQKDNKEDIKQKFKHYIIDDKYDLFVGKDSKNNDLLTQKFANQNDYWFHARSVPGSHVVLRIDNPKEGVPKNVLKKAAAIAAFHSKAKTAGVVPVSFTLKKYVIKKKGMAPGKVALLKEDTLLIRPEIPNGCEFVTEE